MKSNVKRMIAVLCCGVLIFALAGCSLLQKPAEAPVSSAPEKAETSTPAPTAEPTPAPEEAGAVPTPAPEGEETEESTHGAAALPMPESADMEFVAAFMENPIDLRYSRDLNLASSLTEITEVNNTTAESWKNQIDAAYMHILEIGDADTVNAVKAEQEAWLDAQNAQLQSIRDSVDEEGAVSAVNVSENIMLYYRSRAIDLCAVVYGLEGQITFG